MKFAVNITKHLQQPQTLTFFLLMHGANSIPLMAFMQTIKAQAKQRNKYTLHLRFMMN